MDALARTSLMRLPAYEYADDAHDGQVRKYTFEPYVEHPLGVAELIFSWLSDNKGHKKYPELFSAALLHDVVEDTFRTIEHIERDFGTKTARFVWFLTDVPKMAGNRRERKMLDAERLKYASEEVKIIKFFDNIHNLRSIAEHDPKFFKVYLDEKKMLERLIQYDKVVFAGKKLPVEWLTKKHIMENIG